MKIVNSQQEEYKAFLKNIREEKEESSNFVKLVFTVVTAILCAIIVCVILVENNIFLNNLREESAEDMHGVFKYSHSSKKGLMFHFLRADKISFCLA